MILFILFCLTNTVLSQSSNTKMRVKILPGDKTSPESTRYVLNKLKKSLRDTSSLPDNSLLHKIKPETIQSTIKTAEIKRVKVPIDCDSIDGGCNEDKIHEELSNILNVPLSRLRVRVIQN